MHEADSLFVKVPVRIAPKNEALNLTGASVEAVAQRTGGEAKSATATVTDAPGGIVTVSFAPDSLASAVYQLQVRATLGAEVQTVLATSIHVRQSIRT